ncbi:protein of unknown function DUF21 [Isosphaera pallida ATCC 43644]|jgi:CBS domain containing-hemolysin-like protein|uniref:CBS domain containing protein n=1 Tax=Isosphaera pallida (strain ATCC 43644 / DSM 9630 / IS1B) TaxID=575540 RepID=E8R5L8_ISOPI|nr:hemolysin family protein [Isosphaera pallida]ADV61767.1 protein of unknown function DUF21 [Isosphaera pallida ATCC 43644]
MTGSDAALVALLLFANALFVAAEFALVKVRVSQIDELVERGHTLAKMTRRMLDQLDSYISAAQLGITLASLALGRVIESSVEPMIAGAFKRLGLEDSAAGIEAHGGVVVPLLALGITTFFHISLGEQVPKILAIRTARTVALWTGPPMVVFHFVCYPVIVLFSGFTNFVLRLMRVAPADLEHSHTSHELRKMVAESFRSGQLTDESRSMIENVLTLGEKTARRVMIPRPDIVSLSLSRPFEENLKLIRTSHHSRLPIGRDDLEEILGVVHVKDVVEAEGRLASNDDLVALARPVPLFPETIRLNQLFKELRARQTHLAMLADEFGSLVGMVTLENVLEALVGPILDEFDQEPPEIQADSTQPGAFWILPTCPLDTFEQVCGLKLSNQTEADTLGQFVLERLGRLAKIGDVVNVGAHRLRVIEADRTRIRRLRLEPISPTGLSSSLTLAVETATAKVAADPIVARVEHEAGFSPVSDLGDQAIATTSGEDRRAKESD